TCAVDIDDDSGMAILLSGHVLPGAHGARDGTGDLHLRVDRLPDATDTNAREVVIDFDNGDGRVIDLLLTGVVADGVERPNPVTYHFERADDGSGAFHVEIIGDLALTVAGDED